MRKDGGKGPILSFLLVLFYRPLLHAVTRSPNSESPECAPPTSETPSRKRTASPTYSRLNKNTGTKGYFRSGPANQVRRSLRNVSRVHQFICFQPQSLAGMLELHSSCLPCGRPWVQSPTSPEPKAAEVIQPHIHWGLYLQVFQSKQHITLVPMAS